MCVCVCVCVPFFFFWMSSVGHTLVSSTQPSCLQYTPTVQFQYTALWLKYTPTVQFQYTALWHQCNTKRAHRRATGQSGGIGGILFIFIPPTPLWLHVLMHSLFDTHPVFCRIRCLEGVRPNQLQYQPLVVAPNCLYIAVSLLYILGLLHS